MGIALLVLSILSLGLAVPSKGAEPGACGAIADKAEATARQLVTEFREHFAQDVLVPDWCFASDDDYTEVADRLVRVCRERPEEAMAEALALVALKAGRCAGFEAGRRSTRGSDREPPHFGTR
jgi:hypothetical protein